MNENIAKLSACTLQLQESTKASVQNLERQIGQLYQVGHVQAQTSGRLPTQTKKNPEIKNVSCINIQEKEEEAQEVSGGDRRLAHVGHRKKESETKEERDSASDRRSELDSAGDRRNDRSDKIQGRAL